MILLWGLMDDAPLSMVYKELEKAGADVFFLDHREIFNSDIEYTYSDEDGAKCIIDIEGTKLDLDMIHAAYLRPYNFRDYPQMEGKTLDDPLAEKAIGFEIQLMAWLDASDALVVNKSDPSATNCSKPYQLSLIKKAGFKVPETFISNEKELVEEFLTQHGESVYKSISSVRSIVHKVANDHLDFIDDVKWCPTLFQKVVPGINYRAHVFKNEIYTVRIESDSLDYRYGQTTMVAEELPFDIAQKCYHINEILGLHFSGIDLMRTDDDEWYCFEVNTSPAYSYFELSSGLPISRALAKVLIEADRVNDTLPFAENLQKSK
jgi:glutathione synthase/RimK-type ligase-like ATP-grasp enzyme